MTLIIAWFIDATIHHSSAGIGKSTRSVLSILIWLLVSIALLLSIFTVVGGTIMQLVGIYRNCICQAGLRYVFNYDGGIVQLASDTQQNRNNWLVWQTNAMVALSFFAFVLLVAALNETWMKEKFKYNVRRMRKFEELEEKDDQELASPLVYHDSEE